MTKEEFNNQPLPKSDANANLETLSRNKLRAMFNPNDFEVRDEYQYDKGIDLFIEIKANGSNTNLRFPIQLKATQSVEKNKDGTISFPLRVANINYLLNDGLPAFYILYHSSENVFYYERAREVEKMLLEKYNGRSYPESFTFRFNKFLDISVIEDIHAEMLRLGLLRRNLNKAMKLATGHSTLEDTLVIQKNQQVYSTMESVKFLEKYGYDLLNEGRFQLILAIERTCYPLETASPSFHFICGTAFYHLSQLYKALYHYKQASENRAELNPEIQNMLNYYTVQSKRSLGMIDAGKTSGYIEALLDSEYLGLHLKLQKASEEYYTSKSPDQIKLQQFQKVIDSVINDPHCDESLKLIAESYILSTEGHRLNDQLLNYLLKTRDSIENPFVDSSQYKPRLELIESYNEHFKALKAKALAQKNQYTYNIICLNGIKIQYVKSYYTDIVLGADRKTLTIKSNLDESDKKLLNQQADYVGEIAAIYEQLNSLENMIAALSQKYELLHFLQDFEEADKVLIQMEQLIADNDFHGLEGKVKWLRNGGTGHETFAKFVLKSLSKANQEVDEATKLHNEISQMDAEDEQRPTSISEETCQLQIIPLGLFCFSEAVLDRIFEVLHTTEKAKQSILGMMKMDMVPIVNIYNDPVLREGPAGGALDNKGFVSLKRVHKIRKELRQLEAYKETF